MATELAAREAAVEKLALAEMVHDTRAKARAAIPERVRRESAVGDTERFDYHRLNQAEWALVGRASATQRPKATVEEYKAAWDRLVAATGTDSTDAMLMKHVDATASIELLAESRRAAEERVAKLRAEKDGLVQQSRDVEHLGYRKLQSKDVEPSRRRWHARAPRVRSTRAATPPPPPPSSTHAPGSRGLCRAAAAAGWRTSLHDPRGRTAIAAYRRWAVSDPIAEAAAAAPRPRSATRPRLRRGGRPPRRPTRLPCWAATTGRGRRGVGGGGGGERGGERGGGGGGGGRGGGGGGRGAGGGAAPAGDGGRERRRRRGGGRRRRRRRRGGRPRRRRRLQRV